MFMVKLDRVYFCISDTLVISVSVSAKFQILHFSSDWRLTMKVGFTFRIFTVFLYVVVATESSTYRAAVYEHAVVLPSERELPVNRSTALENMMKNVEVYMKQAVIAGQQVFI